MAKTKRKQLAALAAIKVGFPASNGVKTKSFQDLHNQASTKETLKDTCIENSPSPEVRQQRIIIWIPSSDPRPSLVSVRKRAKIGTPTRKRKRSNDKGEGKSSSDTDAGRVYQKVAKIIFKLDNWRLEKSTEVAGPSNEGHETPPRAAKAYRRMKSSPHTGPKKGLLSVLVVNNEPSSTAAALADETGAPDENAGHLHFKLPSNRKGEFDRVVEDSGVARESLSDVSRILRRPKLYSTVKRKAASLGECGAAIQAARSLEQGEPNASRKRIFNPTRKVVIASEKEAEISPGETQGKGSGGSTRQKSKVANEARSSKQQTMAIVEAPQGVFVSTRQKSRKAQEMLRSPEQSQAGADIATGNSYHDDQEGVSKSASKSKTLSPVAATDSAENSLTLLSSPNHSGSRKKVVSLAHTSMSGPKVTQSCAWNDKKYQQTSPASLRLEKQVVPSHTLKFPSGRSMTQQPQTTPLTCLSKIPLRSRPISKEGTAVSRWQSAALSLGHVNSNRKMLLSGEAELLDHKSGATTLRNGVTAHAERLKAAILSFQGKVPDQPNERNLSAYRVQNWSLRQGLRHEAPSMAMMNKPKEGYSSGNSQLNRRVGWSAASLHGSNGVSRSIKFVGPTGVINKFQPRLSDGVPMLSSTPMAASTVQGPKQGGSRSVANNVVDSAAKVRSKLQEVGGLTEWLVECGLGVFVGLFQDRKIGEGDLLHLTMGSLKEMGVHAVGPRRKLISMIEHLL